MTDNWHAPISPAFAKALVKAQSQIEGAAKGSNNPQFKSKYADLSACWDACREALHNNDLMVTQMVVGAAAGFVGLESSFVYGPTGEMLTSVAQCPVKDPTNPQAVGSALTYLRRYTLCGMVGICPTDDDGNSASQAPRQQSKQTTVDQTKRVTSLENAFSSQQTLDGMKAVYTEARNSAIDEPAKTLMLTNMAGRIKAFKADGEKVAK